MSSSSDQPPSSDPRQSNEENVAGGGGRLGNGTINNAPFGPSLSNLSSPSLGSRILFATDEWFATADNLLLDSSPVFVPDLYCEQGKVMDGWETRRKRTEGHDWCVLRLGGRGGEIRGLEVDTAHFTGNHVPQVSVEVATVEEDDNDDYDSWCPGAKERLERGGGAQGTGASPSFVRRADEAVRAKAHWTEILPRTPLEPGYDETRLHLFTIGGALRKTAGRATHVRVNYYPDGGVARIRMWGAPSLGDSNAAAGAISQRAPSSAKASVTALQAVNSSRGDLLTLPPRLDGSETWTSHSSAPYPHPELSSSSLGGRGLECSNRHYGVPANLVQPTYGRDMGDGWETARHPDRPAVWVKDASTGLLRSKLGDWAVLKLGGGGTATGVSRVIVDTRHFRGNYPESFMVEGCYCPPGDGGDDRVCTATPKEEDEDGEDKIGSTAKEVEWFPLVPRTRAGPDTEHVYGRSGPGVVGRLVNGTKPVTHVRVRIYPDGGLSRVRIYGEAAAEADGNDVSGKFEAPTLAMRSHL